jgi:hypothetical protein
MTTERAAPQVNGERTMKAQTAGTVEAMGLVEAVETVEILKRVKAV